MEDIDWYGIYSTTQLSKRKNLVMILSKGKSSYGMATPEEETSSAAAAAEGRSGDDDGVGHEESLFLPLHVLPSVKN